MKNISKKITIIQYKNQQDKQPGEATQIEEGTVMLLCEIRYGQCSRFYSKTKNSSVVSF